MIKNQSLSAEDLLWNKEMEKWLSVESLPEFGIHLVNASSGEDQDILNFDSQPSVAKSNQKVDLLATSRILKSQSPWVMFISIFMYISAAGMFLGFLFALVKGGQDRDPQLIAQGIIWLVQMVGVVFAAIFLNRFVSSVNRFSNSKRVSDLNLSFSWLHRFWLLVSIVLIIWLFFVVTALIYLFAVGGAIL